MNFLIKTCLDIDLFSDAYEYFLIKLQKNTYLDEEERNLFMKTAKSKLSTFRNGWKNLLEFEHSDEKGTIPKYILESNMTALEAEIKNFCYKIISLLNQLISNLEEDDFLALIFYNKMKADYLRYFAEVITIEDEFSKTVDECQDLYQQTFDMCNNKLEAYHPLTLSVALNFSIFYYYIRDDTKRAFNIADKAYKQAMLKYNTESKIPEIEQLIKSIEDNLTIWKIELFDVN